MTPEKRHQGPGRRDSDKDAWRRSAMVDVIAEDRLFPAWKKEDAIKWLTILGSIVALYAGFTTWFAARFATRREITEQIEPVSRKLDTFAGSTNARLNDIEARQHDAEAVHQLLVPMARIQCMRLEIDRSSSLAQAAGLPCDSLLSRRR